MTSPPGLHIVIRHNSMGNMTDCQARMVLSPIVLNVYRCASLAKSLAFSCPMGCTKLLEWIHEHGPKSTVHTRRVRPKHDIVKGPLQLGSFPQDRGYLRGSCWGEDEFVSEPCSKRHSRVAFHGMDVPQQGHIVCRSIIQVLQTR